MIGMNKNGNGGGRESLNLNVNIADAETVECKNCQSKLFEQKFVLKKISKVVIGAPEDVTMTIPIWVCIECTEIIDESIPEQLGTKEELLANNPKKTIINE